MKNASTKKAISEKDIDRAVIAEANDDSAWEAPVSVRKTAPTLVSLPAEIAARAAFVARLHRKTNLEQWITEILQERLAIEENIYSEVKRELSVKNIR